MGSRVIRIGAAVTLTAAMSIVVTPAVAAQAAVIDCKVKIGAAEPRTQPWEQKRLDVQRVWPVSDGTGQVVAVVDSGFTSQQEQLDKIRLRRGVNVSGVFGPSNTRDCYFHGTAVTGIIAAPKVDGKFFTGVAPGVTIMPIKEQQGHDQSGRNHIAEAILAAVAAHVDVINISITTPVSTPDLEAAVAAADRANIVVVAAGAEDGASSNQVPYPAAYSTTYDNVLAVAMTGPNDAVPSASTRGSYLNIAAPGDGVELPMPVTGYLANQSGTSYATPVVTGTVALVRAAHPRLNAHQVVSRIEATADAPPGVTVPSDQYGYGIVNPYLAVTAVLDDAAGPLPPAKPRMIAAPAPQPPEDRHLQHLALAVGTILLGLAVLAGLVAAIVRRGSWFPGAMRSSGSAHVNR